MRGEAFEPVLARIHHDELAAALGELFEIRRGHWVIFQRVAADHDRHIGDLTLVERGRHSAGADVLNERRDRRGVAQTRAVVDVVVTKALTDEFLEEISLFIGAFGRAEAGHFTTAALETTGGEIERLFPGGFAEVFVPIARVYVEAFGGSILTADERFGQAVLVVDVVIAKAAFDAEAAFVGGAIDALNVFHLVVFDLDRDLASHTAEGADAFHLAVIIGAVAHLIFIDHGGWHERTCWAGLNAFPAGHTGAVTHRVGEIEGRVSVMATTGHADHVVDLHFAAGADAETALDAGIQVDAHGDVAVVEERDAILL